MGFNKSASQKQANRAFKSGITKDQISGSFRRYLDKLYFKEKTLGALRVYGEHIYLFNSDNVLITILYVPMKYKKIAIKIGSRKNGKNR